MNINQNEILKKRGKQKNILKRYMPEKIKKRIKNIFLKKKATPKACTLFMTDRCNFKCKGCRRSVLKINKSKEMRLNTVKKLLSLYPNIKFILAEGALIEDFERKRFRMIPVIDEELNVESNIAFLKDQPLSPAANAFLKLIRV